MFAYCERCRTLWLGRGGIELHHPCGSGDEIVVLPVQWARSVVGEVPT